MTECIHGLDQESCDACSSGPSRTRWDAATSMAGKRFALIYAPEVRADTFLHLNRKVDHWKVRWYSSPIRPAVELAQSGLASTRKVIHLGAVEVLHEIAYP